MQFRTRELWSCDQAFCRLRNSWISGQNEREGTKRRGMRRKEHSRIWSVRFIRIAIHENFYQEEAKKQEEKEREEAAKLRSYSNLMTEDNMKYKLLCQFLA